MIKPKLSTGKALYLKGTKVHPLLVADAFERYGSLGFPEVLYDSEKDQMEFIWKTEEEDKNG